jgi:hypothetical protein
MRKAIAVSLCSTFCAVPAVAWNGFGHMEVAAVAWDRLKDKPEIQARITELLKLNPMHDSFAQGVPASLRDKVVFMRAATWPDIIKGDHQHVEDGAPGSRGNRPTGTPNDSRNIGYSDDLMHKYWHFVDEPFSPDGTRTKPPEEPNAQTRIAAFRAALSRQSNVSDEVRSYDLTWLLHIVGDVHQPLHATSRFTQTHTDGDNGGNAVKIRCGQHIEVFCGTSALHTFWDDLLGPENALPDRVIAAATSLNPPREDLASISDETVWIDESFNAAQAVAYAAPISKDPDTPSSLSDTYKRNALKTAKERVALAGARLANLLAAALR